MTTKLTANLSGSVGTHAAATQLEALRIELTEICHPESEAEGFLGFRDAAEFKRIGLELVNLLAAYLGVGNDFADSIKARVGGPLMTGTYEAVRDVEAMVRASIRHLDRFGTSTRNSRKAVPYVSRQRIIELQGIDPNEAPFDPLRLVRLCEELNNADENDRIMSVAMLVRAIIDHVPPVFGQPTFPAVASSYRGGKTFKNQMQRLDKASRDVADSHLHAQIRAKESLPEPQQVDFRSELDALLAEVSRLLK